MTDLSRTLALLRIAAKAGLAPDADIRLLALRATFWIVEPDSAIDLCDKLIAALERCASVADADARAEGAADFAAILQEIEAACRLGAGMSGTALPKACCEDEQPISDCVKLG